MFGLFYNFVGRWRASENKPFQCQKIDRPAETIGKEIAPERLRLCWKACWVVMSVSVSPSIFCVREKMDNSWLCLVNWFRKYFDKLADTITFLNCNSIVNWSFLTDFLTVEYTINKYFHNSITYNTIWMNWNQTFDIRN